MLGASGHGKVVADAALEGQWTSVVFFDDAWPRLDRNGRWAVQGNSEHLFASLDQFEGVVVSIGHCATRWNLFQQLSRHNAPLVTIVHPSAIISRYASIGNGSVVCAGAVINADVLAGAASIINTGATIDHDCTLGDAVHVCPGAHLSGNVDVGSKTWIGVGSAIRQGVKIGADVMVGAGSVVVKSVPDGATVFGNPARPYFQDVKR